jgi:hypothetical protein
MNGLITLLAAMVLSNSAGATETRDVATLETAQTIETAAVQRSFFQPKTLEDINALVTLENDLESDLSKELSN